MPRRLRAQTGRRSIAGRPDASANPVNGQFLGQLTILANDRNQRVLDAQPRIPTLLWGGLAFGGVVLVALTGFHAAEPPGRPHHLVERGGRAAWVVAVHRLLARPSVRDPSARRNLHQGCEIRETTTLVQISAQGSRCDYSPALSECAKPLMSRTVAM